MRTMELGKESFLLHVILSRGKRGEGNDRASLKLVSPILNQIEDYEQQILSDETKKDTLKCKTIFSTEQEFEHAKNLLSSAWGLDAFKATRDNLEKLDQAFANTPFEKEKPKE